MVSRNLAANGTLERLSEHFDPLIDSIVEAILGYEEPDQVFGIVVGILAWKLHLLQLAARDHVAQLRARKAST